MLIDLQLKIGNYFHEVFVNNLDWWVVLGVFFSLFGLFLLSTDRHNEMRQILVRERHEREAVKEASQDQRQLEKKRKAYRARRLKARQLKRK